MIPESIQITDDLSGALDKFFSNRQYSKIGVLVDENTETHCLSHIVGFLQEHWLIKISSGEEHKNLRTCEQIWEALTEASFDRKSLLINLGGGVIGDMGGFCATTFKRGIDFLNIPTTLLSQVDASVGGKLGIDFNGLKNHIGVFQHPQMVIISPQFLSTLSKRELRSGFAEVLKHALIADKDYWNILTSVSLESQDWETHIRHSINVKSGIVEEDPFEKGQRKLLNFGHTIGHAIETVYLDSENEKLLHGEAIAIGIICEAFISTKKVGLTNEELLEIAQYIKTTYDTIGIGKDKFERILELCQQDKKNLGNVINCTLLKHLGEGVVNVPISTGKVLDSIFYYNQLDK